MTFPTAPAPHAVAHDSVGRVMRIVIYALLPTVALHVMFFGAGLLVQIVLGAATALISEALALRLRHKPFEPFLKDGSAIVTAILLALCLPPLAPWWLVVSGTAFAILLAKHLYGGLGANPFNPAMVGYAVLLVSFPVQLLQWLPPAGMDIEQAKLSMGETIQTILTGSLPSRLTWDAVTSPTPLDALRTNLKMGMTMAEAQAAPIFGALGGRGWEWINLATLAGGLALLQLRIIRWHIPVAMLGAIVVCASLMYMIDPGTYAGPIFHLTSGASLLGAFFIATDPISAATSDRGRLIYGAGIGVLTYVIRTWGGYPDGVAFAVLLMNLSVPLIDRYTIPRIYGHAR
ncbi:electron transport complex subunit RsxD [Steroidobacter agaridevorans]|uniref:Ion-translocating oxidoreductase complex subunit D n=1 Tax=Steroidobacter agaridevorans TaxID=2695856 RepID=A0A829YMS5_9GAMM|nr:electron transport complex subunit RsxD [Steroidobacter agaridevorans]GFE84550.1 electron transport complex subunit RsxD [Steroidobacter agaridevorans]GFE90949.1 electron transport complex subunit RsxD [Steroidobacter agaridevorans]